MSPAQEKIKLLLEIIKLQNRLFMKMGEYEEKRQAFLDNWLKTKRL